VDRRWSQVGVRAVAVGLLAAGVLGGLYLGQSRDVQIRGHQAQLAVETDADDLQLLKTRQNDHAAARAEQRVAESNAAAKAAVAATSAAGQANSLRQALADQKAATKKAKESTGTVPYTGPIPTSCKEFVGNRAVGCALMLDDGFTIDQFPCLNKLWNRESGWNAHADNKGSGAYGIPQALPGTKMSSVGSDWQTNPATQIKWGLGYIKGRYKTPCNAWSTSENTGAY
jgi:hypothetical protein